MSRNVLEKVLHQLTVDRSAKQRFRDDADAYLRRFAFSEAQRAMLMQFDVLGLQQAGVNPMLTMGFWQELSPERDMRAYMKKLRPVGSAETLHSAALKR